MKTTNSDQPEFQIFLVEKGVVNENDLRDIETMTNNTNVSLGMIALNHGLLTSLEVKRIMKAQAETGKKFGEAAVELEILDEDQLRALLAEQATINFDVGEILVMKGRLSAKKLEEERQAFARRHA
jgi:aspartate ammonia-lyase